MNFIKLRECEDEVKVVWVNMDKVLLIRTTLDGNHEDGQADLFFGGDDYALSVIESPEQIMKKLKGK